MSEDPRQWLLGLERLGIKFGLENMRALMEALGNPHRRFQSVLVAGTNGKGSVTAVVERALRQAGYRSARYTSPHLVRLEERFLIGGKEVESATLDAELLRIRQAIDHLLEGGRLSNPPTFFEVTTAAAFDLFRSEGVEIAAVEVGLGGRLDATNVLTPLATAITTVDFDHQAQLGHTLAAIAAEKAGIVKTGVPVVIGRLAPEAEAVVVREADRTGALLVRAHDRRSDLGSWTPALPGAHQIDNAIVALALLDVVADAGFAVAEADRRRAIEEVRWPGRLEHLLHGDTDVLLDAAHNPAGASALASYLREIGWADAALVFGAMADKDAAGMLAALAPSVTAVVCTTAGSPRAERADVLAELARNVIGPSRVEAVDDPRRAFDSASALSRRVVVAGSVFLVGPLRDILR